MNEEQQIDLEIKKRSILMKMKESKLYWRLKQQLLKEMKSKLPHDAISVQTI